MNNDPQFYGETAAEWLRRWDAGETVWTLEMGGLGPGYEQCIQIACAEVVRDMLGEPVPEIGNKEQFKAWIDKADVAIRRADRFPGMGMSGAQSGAAETLALQFLRYGPHGFFKMVEETDPERAKDKIQVSRDWPRAPRAVS